MFASQKARQYLQALADHFGWRYDPKRREALGLHRGLCCYAWEWQGVLRLTFVSPGARLPEAEAERFAGFRHFLDAGLPASWLEARVEDEESCRVELDTAQLDALGTDRLLTLPDLLAQDFHAHGGPEQLTCTDCKEEPATAVTVVDGSLDYLCGPCYLKLAKRAGGGKLDLGRPAPEPWGALLPRLGLTFLVGAAAWSIAMQMEVHEGAAVGGISPAIPGLFGLLAAVVVLGSQGVTVGRALAILLAVTLAVLLGCIWGYHQFLLTRVPDVTWSESLTLFRLQFLHPQSLDKVHVLAAAVGAGIGLAASHARRTVTVR